MSGVPPPAKPLVVSAVRVCSAGNDSVELLPPSPHESGVDDDAPDVVFVAVVSAYGGVAGAPLGGVRKVCTSSTAVAADAFFWENGGVTDVAATIGFLPTSACTLTTRAAGLVGVTASAACGSAGATAVAVGWARSTLGRGGDHGLVSNLLLLLRLRRTPFGLCANGCGDSMTPTDGLLTVAALSAGEVRLDAL